jgi:hypothetical protein
MSRYAAAIAKIWIDPVKIAEGFRRGQLLGIERLTKGGRLGLLELGMRSSAVEIALPHAVAVERRDDPAAFVPTLGRTIERRQLARGSSHG